MRKKPKSLRTLLYLILAPILIISIPLLFFWVPPIFKIYIVNIPIALVMVLYPLVFYFLWLLIKVLAS